MPDARRPPLPHQYPFLLLDRVLEVRPGLSAVAVKQLSRGDALLDADGHLPTVLLAEVLAQCAGVALFGGVPGRSAVVTRIDRFRSRTVIEAGAELRVSVRIVKVFGRMVKARGAVRAAGRVCAAGEIVLHMELARA